MQAAIENAKANCSAETHCQKAEGSDTYYVTLPAKTLPIMQPLLDLGAATGTSAVVVPLVDLVSPLAQTLIETGYTRTDYSTPTPFQLLPRFNPVTLASDLINDIPEGVRAALNPGLDPLPGWTDPTQSGVTVRVPDTADKTAADTTKVSATSDDTPLRRLSTVTEPETAPNAADPDATAPKQRPSLPKALATKGHPARDMAKSLRSSVRKALGQDGAKDKATDRPVPKRTSAKDTSSKKKSAA
ncbi:pe-PPE, C-terminal domain protein [Mycolicibacterium fortuitum]|uniref:Pe-PPE, C-terminal domain protein n=1 Tax=Mycolicibacterium fortuitum TaxID=1766 RepID=A0A378U8A4_MYCFO|nr:pe-PPE, C-terminal domain protein [Mycolicibacterium fortuitum]